MNVQAVLITFALNLSALMAHGQTMSAVPDETLNNPKPGTQKKFIALLQNGAYPRHLLRYRRETENIITKADFVVVDYNHNNILETSEIEAATYSEIDKKGQSEIYVNLSREKMLIVNNIPNQKPNPITSTNPEEVAHAFDVVKDKIFKLVPDEQIPQKPRLKKGEWGIENAQI